MKVVGTLLILLSASWLGILGGRRLARRPQQIDKLRRDLIYLETEMNYAPSPLPEILRKIGANSEWPLADLWQDTGHYLAAGEGLLAQEAWQLSLADFAPKGALTAADLSLLRDFGAGLGLTDRREQLKKLKLLQEQLAVRQQEAEEIRRKNERIWRTMGLLGGLALIILLF